MRTYYEQIFDRMRRPVLLVAVAIVALLSASGVAMAVTSTKGSDESQKAIVTSSGGSTELRSLRVYIPKGTGFKDEQRSVTFNSNVRSAVVALNGFRLDVDTADGDQDIDEIEANVDRGSVIGPTVHFTATTQYDDVNSDDSYTGWVDVIIIANVE